MQKDSLIQAESILAELKQQTAHQHRATESLVNLMRDDFSLEDYKILLMKFFSFYQPYEQKMAEAIDAYRIELNYIDRCNLPRLLRDLKSFGNDEEKIGGIGLFDDLPALDSKEKVFGSLYVVEGSTLGGQIISRHLKEKFDLDETNGAAFFSGYGKETGKMWNDFRAAITDFAEQGTDRREIVEAANETFEKIGKCLRGEITNLIA